MSLLIEGQPSTGVIGSPSLPAWSLVLAGGDGRRLRPLTRRISGDERPKQFCKVLGQETLVEQTLRLGWNDLGEPRRVMATLARIGARPAWAAAGNRAGRATHAHAAHEEQA
jgi:hypothetical protein